jgi:hypothetical protein
MKFEIFIFFHLDLRWFKNCINTLPYPTKNWNDLFSKYLIQNYKIQIEYWDYENYKKNRIKKERQGWRSGSRYKSA